MTVLDTRFWTTYISLMLLAMFVAFSVVIFIILVAVRLLSSARKTAKNINSSSIRWEPDLQKHLYILKKISQKMEEDRTDLTKSLAEQTALRERCFNALMSSVGLTSSPSVPQKYSEQTEEIINALQTLERDYLDLKNELRQTSPRLMRLLSAEDRSSVTAVVPKKFENTEECDHELCNEVSTSDLLPIILVATKEFFSKLALDNRERKKEVFRRINRCLDQSRKEIKKELNIFSSAATRDEQDVENNTELSLLNQVDSIEKKLRQTFICLNRLRFDMENMMETLIYYDKQFLCVRTKFEACSSEKRMGQDVRGFVNQSRIFTRVASKVRDILKQRAFPVPLKRLNVDACSTERKLEAPCIQSVEQASEKLLSITKETMGSMKTLEQTTKNLENFYRLANSASEGYITFLISLLRSLEDSEMSENKNILEEDNSDFCSSNENDENCAVDKALLAEVCQELNLSHYDVNTVNITAILKDIIKATWKLIGQDRKIAAKEDSFTASVKTSFYTVSQENDEWENIPSEFMLNDVSSDCLIQNSDESDIDLSPTPETENL